VQLCIVTTTLFSHSPGGSIIVLSLHVVLLSRGYLLTDSTQI